MEVKLRVHKTRRAGSTEKLVIFILSLFAVFLILSFLPKEQKNDRDPIQPLSPATQIQVPLKKDTLVIEPGMTLTDILSPYGFSPALIDKLQKDIKPVYNLARIRAGQEIRIFTGEENAFRRLEYDIDDENYLFIKPEDNGFKGEILELPFENRIALIWCRLEENPISSVVKSGEKAVLAMMLSDLFAWDIDFYTDLRQGDTFKIIFEKKYLDGRFVRYGSLLAAEFINQGNVFQAYRYTYPDTQKWDYFAFDGNSLRKEFLKSPIKFARITSRFSFSRFHPIRKVYRPHYGVDYAARIGTPIQATADGTVIFTGFNGAAGRMVKIRHKNHYETLYLHLGRYAQGIKKGAKVKGGQEIGYVGSSGESTGPHLDYRIKYRGKYINPLAWKFKPVEPLRKEYFEDFQDKAAYFRLVFDSPSFLMEALKTVF